ncbi:hypothetical protein DERF_010261 [Dermatophagoides farinae]|uniref:Uncharacterized protein n=1 Tax=Dermatophagoides farinae TaxID=6954 RepID=A0A922HVJ7_DERFA|nr:hypothetical protein DERF_010261 [Dermatophagoides farinae]
MLRNWRWFNGPQTKRFVRRVRLNILFHPKHSILILIITIGLIYVLYQLLFSPFISNHDSYDSQLELLTNMNKCESMNPLAMLVFETFVRRIINTFDMLEVTYFLCYETLWSTLKRANGDHKRKNGSKIRLKITDACFNLCILNEDLQRHDESIIERRFRNNGIQLHYIHSDGIYVLKPTTRLIDMTIPRDLDADGIREKKIDEEELHPILFTIHARIHVFEKDSQEDMYRRIGWRSRLLPSTMCKQLHCFPTNLIDNNDDQVITNSSNKNDRQQQQQQQQKSRQSTMGQLPKLEYLPSLFVNVPREGLEIQKYHYPDTWWTMTDSVDECSLSSSSSSSS